MPCLPLPYGGDGNDQLYIFSIPLLCCSSLSKRLIDVADGLKIKMNHSQVTNTVRINIDDLKMP